MTTQPIEVTIKVVTDDHILKLSRYHTDFRVALLMAMRGVADRYGDRGLNELVRVRMDQARGYGWSVDGEGEIR
jgi:hypothetical protein